MGQASGVVNVYDDHDHDEGGAGAVAAGGGGGVGPFARLAPPPAPRVRVLNLTTAVDHLAFDPSGAALFENDRLYLASPDGVACVTRECQLVWSGGLREVQRGIFSADTMLVIRGPSGEERAQIAVGPQTVSGNAGLVLGALVSQPDLRD